MARKQWEPVKPVEHQSEEDSDSDSEPEQVLMAAQNKSTKSLSPLPPQPPSSSEEEEVEGPDSTLKSNKRARSKAAAAAATPKISGAAKRPAAEDTAATKDGKKAKSEKKPLAFDRKWSEDDEIVILQGMIDKKESHPISDWNSLFEYVKDKLHDNFLLTQFRGKIRKLRNKYEKHKSKGKPIFSNEHEKNLYELSQVIWGRTDAEGSSSSGNVARKAAASEKNKKEKLNMKLKMVGSGSGSASGEERTLMSGGKEEWKKLQREELELFSNQLELRLAQTKLVLDAYKAS